MKIIFINIFTGYNKNHKVYQPGRDAFYLYGMGNFIAKEILKRYNDIVFENWRMDLRIKDPMEKQIDGILCKIFPAKGPYKFFGEYSQLLIKELKKVATEPDTVIHFMGVNNFNYHYYTRYIKKNKIVATHLGGANPYWQRKNVKKIGAKIFSFFRYYLERWIFLKHYDHFITICKPEVDYFQRQKKKSLSYANFWSF